MSNELYEKYLEGELTWHELESITGLEPQDLIEEIIVLDMREAA
jgi:hypothetical protein